ncbi:MAG: hypothetical protein PUE13_00360 [Clostridiales bacterium]|nr:hypothetical protein [Clostridiales bacterium]
MKNLNNKIISVFSAVLLFGMIPAHAEAANDNISIEPETEIKSQVPFGYGGDWNGYGYLFNNSESLDCSEKWLLGMKQWDMKVPLYRMGGDSSNAFYWKTKIGSLDERTSSDFENKGYAEWYKTLSKVTPDVKLMVVFNLNDTVENNKDLVRFLTLMPTDANAVGSDGVNWAQKRVDMGISNPIPVHAFELGNELYPKVDYNSITNAEVAAQAQEYVQKCTELISAVNSVNPNIKLAALTYSSSMISYTDTSGTAKQENEARCRAWNSVVAGALKNDIDFLVHHDYFNIISKTSKAIIDRRDTEYNVILDYIADTDIKILLTETGSYISGGYDIKDSNSMKYALGLGRFYIKVFSMDCIDAVIQYGFNGYEGSGKAEIPNENGEVGGEWWTSYRYCKDGVFRPSAAGAVGNLFAHMTDGSPVSTTVANSGTVQSMAQAFKTQDGKVKLIIVPDVGRQNTDINVNIYIPGYKAVKKYIVSGGNVETADNNSVTPNGVTTKMYSMNGINPTITIPKYSAVGIEFLPTAQTAENDGVGEMSITSDGSAVEITDRFYAGTFSSGSGVSLLILDGDAQYPGASEADIITSDYAEVIDDKCYFKTEMPYDAIPGTYKAVVGTGSTYHVKSFVFGASVLDGVSASCENGRVTASVDFAENAPDGTYTVTALYGQGNFTDLNTHRFAYVGTFEKTSAEAVFSFDMPKEALSGGYTLIVGSENDRVKTNYEYVKNDEQVVITGVPTDASGQEITKISEGSEINFIAKNISNYPLDAIAYACCYRNGKLTSVSMSEEKIISPEEQTDVSLKADVSNADVVKLCIWDKNFVRPYTTAYYIK